MHDLAAFAAEMAAPKHPQASGFPIFLKVGCDLQVPVEKQVST